ncbi:MAG: hypothetical protein A3J24_07550 [Deltaproteobacteria bacterium RIFCSPLOWO2_02_FULL_53_8]|nr:MAG: hypothetical protein A3J24_07550 [Deltaproteobacteria bacterium RIFCSPLOWO2_02_FULL_53_8]
MKRADLQFHKTATFSMGMFVSWMLIVYALSYHPFITESYLPASVRIGIEGGVLFLLVMINLRYQYIVNIVWFIPVVLIFGCTLFLEMDTFIKLVSSFNKLAFLILTIGLLNGNRGVLNTCTKMWVQLSYFLCIMAILAFFGYATKIIPFSPMYLGESVSGMEDGSYYLHNAMLGNLIPRQLFGIDFGRVAGFMYEGGMLGVVLGLNILMARDWIEDPKKRKRFVWLNFIAGITTLSTTFFLFFSLYYLVNRLGEKVLNPRVGTFAFLFLGVLLIVFILGSDYFEQTSGSVRFERMAMYLNIVESSTWLTFLLGNGVGITIDKFGIGLDSGWLAILVERGVIMMVFVVILYATHTKHNWWLMLYIFYANFAFNLFWDPSFLLVVAMSYACFNYNKKRSVVPVYQDHLYSDSSRGMLQR